MKNDKGNTGLPQLKLARIRADSVKERDNRLTFLYNPTESESAAGALPLRVKVTRRIESWAVVMDITVDGVLVAYNVEPTVADKKAWNLISEVGSAGRGESLYQRRRDILAQLFS